MASCASVTIQGSASFTVDSATVSNANPRPGDTVTISGVVRNQGTAAGSTTVTLQWGTSSATIGTYSLAAGASQAISAQVAVTGAVGSQINFCFVAS